MPSRIGTLPSRPVGRSASSAGGAARRRTMTPSPPRSPTGVLTTTGTTTTMTVRSILIGFFCHKRREKGVALGTCRGPQSWGRSPFPLRRKARLPAPAVRLSARWSITSISLYYGASHQYRDKFGLKTKVEGPNWSF